MKKYFTIILLLFTLIYACSEATQEQQNKETSEITESKTTNRQIIEKGTIII